MNYYKLLFETIKKIVLTNFEKSSDKFDNHMTAAIAVKIYSSIIEKYENNNLSYHNLNHIFYMLSILEDNSFKNEKIYSITCDHFYNNYHMNVLLNSILFHDCIYKPYSPINEIESGNYAKNIITKYLFNEGMGDDVRNLIISTDYTKEYYINNKDKKLNLAKDILHELDWSIFGDKYEKFKEYDYNLSHEYIKDIIDSEDMKKFFIARKRFLIKVLEKHKYEKLFKILTHLNNNVEDNIRNIILEKYSN